MHFFTSRQDDNPADGSHVLLFTVLLIAPSLLSHCDTQFLHPSYSSHSLVNLLRYACGTSPSLSIYVRIARIATDRSHPTDQRLDPWQQIQKLLRSAFKMAPKTPAEAFLASCIRYLKEPLVCDYQKVANETGMNVGMVKYVCYSSPLLESLWYQVYCFFFTPTYTLYISVCHDMQHFVLRKSNPH